MLTLSQLCPGVEPSGDDLTFFVRSSSRQDKHTVDLAAYGGSGFCSCEDYQFRVQPLLARGEVVKAKDSCPHIKIAWSYYAISIVQCLLKQGKAHDAAKQPL